MIMIYRKSYIANLFLEFYDTINIKQLVDFNGFVYGTPNVVLPNVAQLNHVSLFAG